MQTCKLSRQHTCITPYHRFLPASLVPHELPILLQHSDLRQGNQCDATILHGVLRRLPIHNSWPMFRPPMARPIHAIHRDMPIM